MQSIGEILNQSQTLNNYKLLNRSGKTDPGSADEPIDYRAWYFEEGNSIRKWDEEHGVKLMINNETGQLTFCANPEVLFGESMAVKTYPTYFQDRTLDRFNCSMYSAGENRDKAQAAFKKTTRYIRHFDRILSEFDGIGLFYYSSERGTGKTFLSTILGNELSNLGHKVRWYTMINLIQEIKSGFDRDSNTSSAAVINQAKNAEVLILDDIGVEKQSAWLNETVYTILDNRLIHHRPTIFTSNKKPEELGYDERIIDRITRMTELIEMPEQSIRKLLRRTMRITDFLDGR